jgi:DtxR family transcriptional regulator, Mn-dependent transcriptional regulator
MTDLIDTTEMYLKAILELEEDGIVPMRARIAERLDHSGPTVSQTVARMERDGLLRVGDDRQLEFTEAGRITAIEVMRKHRLAERLLLEIIGLDWHLVHEEACRWEHVMSEAVELKIAGLLSDVTHSPFGMPVPGLEMLGLTAAKPHACKPVTAVQSGEYELIRIGEPVQVDEDFLLQLRELGLLPGSRVAVTVEKTGWLLSAAGKTEGMLLDELIASHLFVG